MNFQSIVCSIHGTGIPVSRAIDYNRLRDATRTRHNRPHQLVTENRIVPSLHVQSYQRENSAEITGRGHPAAIFPLSSETTAPRDLLSSAFSFFALMSLYARHEGGLKAQEFFNRSSPFSKLIGANSYLAFFVSRNSLTQ